LSKGKKEIRLKYKRGKQKKNSVKRPITTFTGKEPAGLISGGG
jgi:hypothetical protein